jgi:uncharacterized membrane protein YoaK (UPF0700 family)
MQQPDNNSLTFSSVRTPSVTAPEVRHPERRCFKAVILNEGCFQVVILTLSEVEWRRTPVFSLCFSAGGKAPLLLIPHQSSKNHPSKPAFKILSDLSTNPHPMQPQDTSPQPAALPDAMLLAATGGLLDAVVYLNHGHVFANAMSGNVIFLGIAVLGHDWGDIVPHLVPLAGFFAGVLTSKHLRARLGIRSVLLGLALEIVAIFVLGWLPGSFPEMAFTGIIAYVAAFQVASFRRVDRFAYNSTFITGNLRDIAEGLYEAFTPNSTPEAREKGLSQARALGLICLCFLGGAIFGAWSAPRFGNHSLWLAEPFLLAVAVLSFRRPAAPASPPTR